MTPLAPKLLLLQLQWWPLGNVLTGDAAVAPPQQSAEEIRALEAEATFTVQQVAATAVMLYLCMSNSFFFF